MTKQMIFLSDETADSNANDTAAPGGDLGFDDDPNDFRIDTHTREVGRLGIAAAREALAQAVRRAAAREQGLAA